jgi:hypothetical protein
VFFQSFPLSARKAHIPERLRLVLMIGILIFPERLRVGTFLFTHALFYTRTKSVNDVRGIALLDKTGYVPLKNNKNGMTPPVAFKGMIPMPPRPSGTSGETVYPVRACRALALL